MSTIRRQSISLAIRLKAEKVYSSPFGQADIITSTTHKTLRGPRGAVIFCKPEYAKKIDKAVFPGLQGGPHMHTIAAKAVAFSEAAQPSFQQYAKQIVANAKAMAYYLQQQGFRLATDGTDTHLLLLDLTSISLQGKAAQALLEDIGIIANMNMLPFDKGTPLNPSGMRFGTAAITSRGMKEKEMEQVASIIVTALQNPEKAQALKGEVAALAKKFRILAHF